MAMAGRLAREEGLLVGISSGANVVAAGRVAAELGPGKTVVTVLLRHRRALPERGAVAAVARVYVPTSWRRFTGGAARLEHDAPDVRSLLAWLGTAVSRAHARDVRRRREFAPVRQRLRERPRHRRPARARDVVG